MRNNRVSKTMKANKHPLNQLCKKKLEENGHRLEGGVQYQHQMMELMINGSEDMWDYSLLQDRFYYMKDYADPQETLKDMLDADPPVDAEDTPEEVSDTLLETWIGKLQEDGLWSPMEDSRLTIRG